MPQFRKGRIRTWREKQPVNEFQDPDAVAPGGDQCWEIELGDEAEMPDRGEPRPASPWSRGRGFGA